MSNRIFLLSTYIVLLFPLFLGGQDNGLVSILDEYIEKARLQWHVPGLAVTVVKDGEVLLSKGYGEKKLGSGQLVDDRTIFSIGSTTKAMTAAAMAMLVDEGKVSWDDKVIDHYPEFRLADLYASNELRIRDLFTHNSGLGNTDLLWVLWDHSTEEIISRIRNVDMAYGFRGGYTYQNIMYATAGLIIERLSGMAWSDFIRERIFQPLQMENSYPLRSEAFMVDNRSIPHHWVNDEIVSITDSNADSIAAAGSAWSCARDMARWIHFVLDSAKVNSQRLISPQSYAEWQRPQIVIPLGNFYPTARLTKPRWTTYALGWFQHDYQGEYVQFHTGSLNGTVAILGLMPEHKLGVYVFGNLDHAEIRHAIMYKTFDLFTGKPERDWSTEFFDLYKSIEKNSRNLLQEQLDNRTINTNPTLSLKAYEGRYLNDYLGEIRVFEKDANLFIYFRSDRQMRLEHWHYDTFHAKIEQYPFDQGTLISFHIQPDKKPILHLFGRPFYKISDN